MNKLYRTRATASLLGVATMLLLSFSAVAHAQGVAEGSLAGNVTDATEAVLPGVTVTARNVATGFTRESVTETDGKYRLSSLPPGTYEVTTSLQGFTPTRRTVTVRVGAEMKLDVVLVVGAVEETITVSGAAELVEVTATEQSVTFSSSQIENLPTDSRNFLEFALLSPGVVRGRSSGAGWGGESGFSASGNRGDQNAINIDGLVNKTADSGLDKENFAQEGVQEFEVVTQGAPAEFGGTAGGVINAITKSGTNVLSGRAYTFLRDNAFDKPPFDLVTRADGTREAVTAAEAEDFRRVIAGIAVGGPVKKDKIFYFGLVERQNSNTPRVRTIPDQTLAAVKALAIPDLPDNDTNKVTQFKPTQTQGHVKVDWSLSNKHTATVRFSATGRFSPAGAASGNSSITATLEDHYSNRNVGFTLNSVLSSTKLNVLRGQYYWDKIWKDWPQLGGFQNIANFPPNIVIAGSLPGTFGRGQGGGPNLNNIETKWELQDNFTLYRGKHAIKFGGQYLYTSYFQVNDYGPDAVWRFSDLNAFLAGRPTSLLQGWGPGAAYIWVHYFSGFAQDEWQPNNKLTINYGLRYQLDHHPTDIRSYDLPEPAFNPTTGEFTTHAGAPNIAGYKNDTDNIMPRLGLTYTPDEGTTVIRSAAGVYYGNNYLGEMDNGQGWDGAPGQQAYSFRSAEATAIWNGVLVPGSPYYNPAGIRRLPNNYFERLRDLPYDRRPFDPELRMPYSVQASAGVERRLTSVLAVSASYLWSRGWDNVRNVNKNARAGVFYPAGSVLPSGVVTPFDIMYREGPRPDPRFLEVLEYTNAGSVRFKGLSVAATARWTSLTAQASYIWNDAWDDSIAIATTQGPSNPDCVTCEFSRSVQMTKRFVGSVVYQTPESWPTVVRDFQVGTIGEVEAGHPFMVVGGFDFNNDTIATDRPLGVPRNSLITDSYRNASLRVSRNFRLRGRAQLEVLFEMFNLFNRANYSNYDGNLYRFQSGVYVPRADFATFAASPQANVFDRERDPKEIGLDPKQRRLSVGDPFQGQLGFRFRF